MLVILFIYLQIQVADIAVTDAACHCAIFAAPACYYSTAAAHAACVVLTTSACRCCFYSIHVIMLTSQ